MNRQLLLNISCGILKWEETCLSPAPQRMGWACFGRSCNAGLGKGAGAPQASSVNALIWSWEQLAWSKAFGKQNLVSAQKCRPA